MAHVAMSGMARSEHGHAVGLTESGSPAHRVMAPAVPDGLPVWSPHPCWEGWAGPATRHLPSRYTATSLYFPLLGSLTAWGTGTSLLYITFSKPLSVFLTELLFSSCCLQGFPSILHRELSLQHCDICRHFSIMGGGLSSTDEPFFLLFYVINLISLFVLQIAVFNLV